MKDKIFLAACALFGFIAAGILWSLPTKASAVDFPLSSVGATLLTATTNATGSGVSAELPLYHTIHIVPPTNFMIVTLDRSLNNSSWYPFSTNTFHGASNVVEVVATGKWGYLRARISGMTNSGTTTINYLGGK